MSQRRREYANQQKERGYLYLLGLSLEYGQYRNCTHMKLQIHVC